MTVRTQYNDDVRRGIFERRRAHRLAQWRRIGEAAITLAVLFGTFFAGALAGLLGQ